MQKDRRYVHGHELLTVSSVTVEGRWTCSSEVRWKGDDKTNEDCQRKDFGRSVSTLFAQNTSA